jgi:hypothetical protein
MEVPLLPDGSDLGAGGWGGGCTGRVSFGMPSLLYSFSRALFRAPFGLRSRSTIFRVRPSLPTEPR